MGVIEQTRAVVGHIVDRAAARGCLAGSTLTIRDRITIAVGATLGTSTRAIHTSAAVIHNIITAIIIGETGGCAGSSVRHCILTLSRRRRACDRIF